MEKGSPGGEFTKKKPAGLRNEHPPWGVRALTPSPAGKSHGQGGWLEERRSIGKKEWQKRCSSFSIQGRKAARRARQRVAGYHADRGLKERVLFKKRSTGNDGGKLPSVPATCIVAWGESQHFLHESREVRARNINWVAKASEKRTGWENTIGDFLDRERRGTCLDCCKRGAVAKKTPSGD